MVSIVLFTVDVIARDAPTECGRNCTCEYNENGSIRSQRCSLDFTYYITEYEYHDNGKVLTEERTDYNQDGSLRYYSSDHQAWDKYVFDYDDNGNEIYEKYMTGGSQSKYGRDSNWEHNRTFDEAGNILTDTGFLYEKQFTTTYSYDINKNEKTVITAYKDLDGNYLFTGEYTYYYPSGGSKGINSCIISPSAIEHMKQHYNDSCFTTTKDVYCITEASECNTALEAAGYSDIKTISLADKERYLAEKSRTNATSYTANEVATVLNEGNDNKFTIYFK